MIVKISYQTLQLPPPFAFAYTLDLDFADDEINIQYHLEFLNREEITQEEIEDEGFSMDDDFSWQGILGKVWAEDLKEDIEHIELEEESEDFNIYLHAEIHNEGKERSGLAVLAEDWDYRLQELIQAIYEKAGIEAPLHLSVINIDSGTTSKYEVEGSFEHQKSAVNGQPLDWDVLHDVMSDIYTIDFDQEPVKNPKEDGLWINPDGASGYQLFDEQAGPKSASIKKRILKVLMEAAPE